jgi:acetylornithine deacetylase/succinyl-diaminopimelate desuccinylase-like protein
MSAAVGSPLVGRIEQARIADDLWRLVSVSSPTGRERDAALLYAELLKTCGAEVEIDESIPASPSVIGRLKGGAPGPTLQLAGHIDAIDVPHEKPARSGDTISGRGSADMKAGLASILEIVRLLAAEPGAFAGSLLVTVYGRHEAPVGKSEALQGLIARKCMGDAAVVFEGPPDVAVVKGKGQSIWTITLEREGEACHELRRRPEDDRLLDAVLTLAGAFRSENEWFSLHPDDLLGPESIFTGQLHYGDFYNRAPRSCTMQGTRRWFPDKKFDDVKKHLDELVRGADVPDGIKAGIEWTFVGESFAVDPKERIVAALRDAGLSLRGTELPFAGVSSVLDTSRLVPLGHVPTVPIDCDGSTGHADAEFVRMPVVKAGCALALQTALNYLGGTGARPGAGA